MYDELFYLNELKNFLDGSGSLTGYPTKFRLKMISLFYLASKFKQGVQYSEKEVNATLKQWHTFGDWCMLRRDLFDRRFFDRTQNCAVYWLAEPQPVLADFGLAAL